MRLVTPAYEMFSKDGPYLQYILIQHRPLSQGFQFTRQNIEGGMLPHEMARVLIDNIHSDPLIRNFKLLSDVPAKVGGRAGFRLIYTYQDRQGVDMKTVYYGTVMGPYYFNLRYTAALRHYFAADLPTFDQVRAGLQLFPDSGALSVPDSNSR